MNIFTKIEVYILTSSLWCASEGEGAEDVERRAAAYYLYRYIDIDIDVDINTCVHVYVYIYIQWISLYRNRGQYTHQQPPARPRGRGR